MTLFFWLTLKEELLKYFKNLNVSIIIIKTKGDQLLEKSLSSLLDKGFFTKEIQDKLYEGNIDLAVHSLKDVPASLDPKFKIKFVLAHVYSIIAGANPKQIMSDKLS